MFARVKGQSNGNSNSIWLVFRIVGYSFIPHFFFGIYSNGFNPRTREGCDAQSGRKLAIADVSIHAPARGATLPEESANAGVSVSIHAPARGATAYSKVH